MPVNICEDIDFLCINDEYNYDSIEYDILNYLLKNIF